ncbi:DUF4232 domain-containing protein [Streptomyces coeruleoprunus]|uniref:DUF4232 domain-containing protein n=1 Tax=Streptomyces coeruleoprunus TaxID=285563 RepID=A0ABV9XKX9_9ACTN
MRRCRANTVLAVAVLSLGLAACGGGSTGARDEGPAVSLSPVGTSGGADTTVSGGAITGGGTTAASGSAKRAASGEVPACTHRDLDVTMAKAGETPTEHIVLTATNASGRTCRLHDYPLIAFGDIQTAKDVPAVAKSKPAAPVVLKPGAPAYANVRVALGGVAEENRVVSAFHVNFFVGGAPAEGSVVVEVPSGGLAVDDAVAKTGYWTRELRNGVDEF